MNKLIFTVLSCLLFVAYTAAQSIGISAFALAFSARYPDQIDKTGYTERTMGHLSSFSPGFRIEGNWILPGYSFPVSGFNGIGFSCFFPHTDSAFFTANTKNNTYNTVDIAGTAVCKRFTINLRAAYEIPQNFSEFLLLHAGWGMGFTHYSSRYILPEKTATFNYVLDDLDPEVFLPEKNGNPFIELLFGGAYELEKFSFIAQYSVSLELGADRTTHPKDFIRHGLTAGVYLPLKKL
ncbi:hypothetical protein BH11BAC7_BH11BAC7_30450 [soil metagenome]